MASICFASGGIKKAASLRSRPGGRWGEKHHKFLCYHGGRTRAATMTLDFRNFSEWRKPILSFPPPKKQAHAFSFPSRCTVDLIFLAVCTLGWVTALCRSKGASPIMVHLLANAEVVCKILKLFFPRLCCQLHYNPGLSSSPLNRHLRKP